MSNLRNSQLLQQIGRHPLKASLARALDIAEMFEGDVQFLQLDKNLSDQGRQNAMQSKLRAAVRDLRDTRAPIVELEQKLAAKRKLFSMPPTDPADVVGFLRRQELRAALRTMDAGQRAVLIAQDPMFADAMLEQPPSLSGLLPGENFVVENAKEARLGALFGPQLAEIGELEKVVAEANMIADVARVGLQSSSQMEWPAFNEFVKPIENRQGAPWLLKSGDQVVRVRPELKGTPQLHQPATEQEIRDGVYYDSEMAYAASRAA
jgi:hypothetical protein